MARTASLKTNLKPNEFTGIKTTLLGCANVLMGIAEMFPEHRGHSTITGGTQVTPAPRGRPRGNVQTIGKKAA